jgi:hypothetical protein
MACIANLSPSHRPPQPSLNNGSVQRQVRRAFTATGQPVLSTTQIMDWSHPRPGTNRHMRAGLSVASASATASVLVAARALVGRSCGGCATENSVPSQPRNHREIDRVASRDRGQGFACSTPLDSLSPLIGRELGLAAKFDAVRHRPLATLTSALPDQLALKLRDGGQQRREQPTLRA